MAVPSLFDGISRAIEEFAIPSIVLLALVVVMRVVYYAEDTKSVTGQHPCDDRLASLTEGGNRFTEIVLQPNGVYSQEEIDALQQTDT